jgi:hypothetical protein
MNKPFNKIAAGNLAIIIGTGLIVQFITVYFGWEYLVYNGFCGLIFLIRTIVPIGIGSLIGLSFCEMGVALPGGGKNLAACFIFLMLLIVPFVFWCFSFESMRSFYYSNFSSFKGDKAGFARYFAFFTISTNLPWEFLHRGFLLFGLEKTLRSFEPQFYIEKQNENQPGAIKPIDNSGFLAMMFVLVFETVYHFSKPAMEALGMSAASILLSVIALKSRSIFYPMLLHACIEIFFGASIITFVL